MLCACPAGCGILLYMESQNRPHYVYVLRCADGTLYTGYAVDPARRLLLHNAGRGAKYVRARRPAVLVYREACPDKSCALRREAAIKKLSHAEKEALIRSAPTTP